MTTCPKCGAEMSSGYVGTQTFPTGLQWYGEVSSVGFRPGEPFATIQKLQMEYVPAQRCEDCRLILIAY